MNNIEKRLQEMINKLKEKDFRITPQRLAILKTLAESFDHPSVETIYGKVKADFPTTSLATIYKTLIVMKELGQVFEIGLSDGSNRYDGTKPYPHPHLICSQCKKIIDLNLDNLNHLTKNLAQNTGFKIYSHRLDFFGVCPECQKNKAD